MKNESKRYSLVQFALKKVRSYDTEEEYNELLDIIASNNKNKKSKYIFGNVMKEYADGKIIATVSVYVRLDEPMLLEDIDNLTMDMKNSNVLKEYYSSKLIDRIHGISIAYLGMPSKIVEQVDKTEIRIDKRIKELPVLYFKDLKYMDLRYIRASIATYAERKDYAFFYQMCNWFLENRNLIKCVEDIRSDIEKVKYYGLSSNCLINDAMKFFSELINKKDKNNKIVKDEQGRVVYDKRKLRDFAVFLKSKESEMDFEPINEDDSNKSL